MPGRNVTTANEGDGENGREVLVYLRPGVSVQADQAIELRPLEFGRSHCTLKARPLVAGGRIAKRRAGRLFILTLV